MVPKVAVKHELEAGLRHAMTGKFSLATQQLWYTFFEAGKDSETHCPYGYVAMGNILPSHFT